MGKNVEEVVAPLQEEDMQQAVLERRDYSQTERDDMDDSDFGDPENQAFPIKTAQDVINAASRLHDSKGDQDAIKARIKRIAKRKGFPLPKTWQEEDKQERFAASVTPPAASENVPHLPMTDYWRAATGENSPLQNEEYRALYMPVTYMSRREGDEWIVEGQATAEVPDSFGTIFAYEASKKAFQRWMAKYANVREMHGKKAAGKGIDVQYDDQNRRILVRTRVSKAEPGVWTKFHEGVLNGFSIGTTRNYKMGRMNYQGKSYPSITDYELAELSYVDAPSCPGSDAHIVARMDGSVTEIIDDSIDDSEEQPSAIQTIATSGEERAGARLSEASRSALHEMRDKAIQLCGCDECQGMTGNNEPDGDETMAERVQQILERSLTPVYQRQQAFLARLAGFDTFKEFQSQLGEIKAVLERVAASSTIDEVRAEFSAVRDRVQKIEDTPAPGGPVLHGARPRNGPYEKAIPLQPQQQTALNRAQIERETLERLQASGAFQTQEDQVAAAALLIRRM